MKETMLDVILREVDDRAEQKALAETWDRLGELEHAEPGPALARRFGRMLELTRASVPRPASPGRRWVPLAAGLLVGMLLGGLAVRVLTVPAEPSAQREPPRADLDRLSRVVSLAFRPQTLAPQRLEAVEALARLAGDPGARQVLSDVVTQDPSADVRLCAIEALERHAAEPQVVRRLIEAARSSDSPLVRIRLIELFVDRDVDAARAVIEAMIHDPRADSLVRDTAQWADGRFRKRRQS